MDAMIHSEGYNSATYNPHLHLEQVRPLFMKAVTLVTAQLTVQLQKIGSWSLLTRPFSLLFGWLSDIIAKSAGWCLRKRKRNLLKVNGMLSAGTCSDLCPRGTSPWEYWKNGWEKRFNRSNQRCVSVRNLNIFVLSPSKKPVWRKYVVLC